MKIADHPKFHERWEGLQGKLGRLLSLAHTDPWVSIDGEYKNEIDSIQRFLDFLRAEKLDSEREGDVGQKKS